MQNSVLETRLKEIRDEEFIGLEYVIEVNIGKTFEPVFYCVLCDNTGRMEINIVVSHLTAFNHRLKYLEKHFPTAFKEISVLKSDKRKCKIILEKLCKAIEDKYGRQSVLVVQNNDFVKNRMKFTEQALHTTHFDEYMGCTFIEVIRNEADKGKSYTSSLLDSKYGNLDRRLSLDSSYTKFKTPEDVIVQSRKLGLYSTSTSSTSNWTPSTNQYQISSKLERFNSYSERGQNQMCKIETFRSTDLMAKTRHERKRDISEFSIEGRNNRSRESSYEEESSLRTSRSNSVSSKRSHRRSSPKRSRSYKESRSCRRSRSPKPYRSTPGISSTALHSLKQSRLSPRMSSERFEHQPNYSGYRPRIGSWRKSTNALGSLPTSLDYQPFNASSTFSIPKEASLSCYKPVQSTIPFNLYESRKPMQNSIAKPVPSSETYITKENIVPEVDDREPITVLSVLRTLIDLKDLLGSLAPEVIEMKNRAVEIDEKKLNSASQFVVNNILFEDVKQKFKSMLAYHLVDTKRTNVVKKVIKSMDLLVQEAKERQKAQVTPCQSISLSLPGSNVCSSSQASGNKENNQLEIAIATRIASAYYKTHGEYPTEIRLANLLLDYKIESEKRNSIDNDEIGSRTVVEQHSNVKEVNEIRSVSPVDIICIEDNEELDEHISKVSNNVPSMSLSDISPSASVPFLIPQSLRKEIYSTCPTSSSSDESMSQSHPYAPTSLTYSELKTLISKYESLPEETKKMLQKHLRILEKEKPKIMKRLMKENDLSKVWL